VEEGAVLGPDAVLTADVQVARGAAVRDSVLWAGCRVGPESSVEVALLGLGVRTGCHVRIAPGALLGDGSYLPDYSRSA
jgi:NDP-sugar pyrophosphorylase family protein